MVLADRAEAGVGGLILAGSDGFDFLGPGVEDFAFFEGLVVIGHATADVDHSLMAENGVAGTRDDQLCYLP